MKRNDIDSGNTFDFGRTSEGYARYRDIYPQSMYERLIGSGVGKPGQEILDLGSGTAVLPVNMCGTGARFTSTDISENQIAFGRKVTEERGTYGAEKAAAEIRRVLKPNGLFCKVFMDWLPYEDEVIAEMEQTVLKYNPDWSGGGFREFRYSFPDWAKNRFELDSVQSYDEVLTFTKEAWLNRVMTCRGVGASLSKEKTEEFKREYGGLLEKYDDILYLKHQIHIEIYRKI